MDDLKATLRLGAAMLVVAGLLATASSARAAQRSDALAADAWAGQVCLAVNTWQNAVETSVTSLRSGSAPVTSRRLLAGIDGLRARTAVLATALQGIGSPDVPQGNAAQGALQNAVATVGRHLAADRSAARRRTVKTYPVSSVWLGTLLRGLSAQTKVVGGAFVTLGTRYPDANLDTTFAQIPLCEVIHG